MIYVDKNEFTKIRKGKKYLFFYKQRGYMEIDPIKKLKDVSFL